MRSAIVQWPNSMTGGLEGVSSDKSANVSTAVFRNEKALFFFSLLSRILDRRLYDQPLTSYQRSTEWRASKFDLLLVAPDVCHKIRRLESEWSIKH